MKENLVHSRTCVYNINYHVVWSVKYRRKILSAEIETYLKELVQKIASDKGFTVHLFEVGEGDHIHCFVSAPPKLSCTYKYCNTTKVKCLRFHGIFKRQKYPDDIRLSSRIAEQMG